jgi:hypothetical protein
LKKKLISNWKDRGELRMPGKELLLKGLLRKQFKNKLKLLERSKLLMTSKKR